MLKGARLYGVLRRYGISLRSETCDLIWLLIKTIFQIVILHGVQLRG